MVRFNSTNSSSNRPVFEQLEGRQCLSAGSDLDDLFYVPPVTGQCVLYCSSPGGPTAGPVTPTPAPPRNPIPISCGVGGTDQYLMEFVRAREGDLPYVYPDSEGHPTVGTGFNLDRAGAAALLAEAGLDYDEVLSTWQDTKDAWQAAGHDLSELKTDRANNGAWKTFLATNPPASVFSQAENPQDRDPRDDQLLNLTIREAIHDAKKVVPGFEKLTYGAQAAVVDMVFNLGGKKFMKFRHLIASLKDRDYDAAAREIMNSKRGREQHPRSKLDVKLLKSGNERCPTNPSGQSESPEANFTFPPIALPLDPSPRLLPPPPPPPPSTSVAPILPHLTELPTCAYDPSPAARCHVVGLASIQGTIA